MDTQPSFFLHLPISVEALILDNRALQVPMSLSKWNLGHTDLGFTALCMCNMIYDGSTANIFWTQGATYQRFPVPIFSIPIPVLRLSKSRIRFRFRFRDQTCLELDSDSETILSPDPRVLVFRFRFRVLY